MREDGRIPTSFENKPNSIQTIDLILIETFASTLFVDP